MMELSNLFIFNLKVPKMNNSHRSWVTNGHVQLITLKAVTFLKANENKSGMGHQQR